MLSDDGIENQFKYLEGLISTCRVRGYDIGESVSLADESLRTLRKWIASGELMVVPKDTAGRCLKCNTRVAEQHNSRKWHFPKFCPNCGKESPEAKA